MCLNFKKVLAIQKKNYIYYNRVQVRAGHHEFGRQLVSKKSAYKDRLTDRRTEEIVGDARLNGMVYRWRTE